MVGDASRPLNAPAEESAVLASRVESLPRLIRMRDAPRYLGMDRMLFNQLVRPHVSELPIGRQGKAFDRLDLDRWADEYKSRCGRPAPPSIRRYLWDGSEHQASSSETGSGTSTSRSSGTDAFAKAVALATWKKPRNSSRAD
jgi:hypothetical protein